jgi:transcriptional regulator with XRE-family HTH domain
MKSLNDKMTEMSETRRQKIEARAAELAAEEMSLRDLRRAHRLTQARVGKALKIGQDGVSRLEQRSDLLISTLRNYVAAMGGELELVARFPHRPAVAVTGLAGIESKDERREKSISRRAARRSSSRVAGSTRRRSSSRRRTNR